MVYGAIQRKDIYIAIALLLLGFLVRWIYVSNLDIDNPLRGDAGSYFTYAKNLLDYGVFSRDRSGIPQPDSYWAPGYPLFLAVCFKLATLLDVNYYPVVLFLQACLGGGIVFFTYAIGRFFLPSAAAAFAAALTILSPHLSSLGGNFLSETLFTFWLAASIFVYLKAVNSPKTSYSLWCLCGGLFGLTYLTNPVVLFVPPFLFVGFLFKQFKNIAINPKLKSWAFCFAVFFSAVFVWQIRDLVSVSSEKESSADRAFQNLIIGSHSDYHSVWRANLLAPPGSTPLFNGADQDMTQFNHDHPGFYQAFLGRIQANPLHYLQWYFLQKPLEFWGWNILAGEGDIYQYPVNSSIYQKSKLALVSLVLMKQLHLLLVALMFFGFFLIFFKAEMDRQQSLLAVYIPLLSMTLIYVILHTDGRYSVPLRPEMYLCAVYATHRLYTVLKALNEKAKLPAASA